MDAVSRRLELLKLEGLGFSQSEIVKELSQKCACCFSVLNAHRRDYIRMVYAQPILAMCKGTSAANVATASQKRVPPNHFICLQAKVLVAK